jgi:putative aldouronate transport system permease protein
MIMTDGASAEELVEMQRLSETIKYGVIVVASLPMLLFYPFLQRYFIKGVMIGSIKG